MTELTALVGRPAALRTTASVKSASLEQGFVLILVGEPVWDAIGAGLADDPDNAGDLTSFLRLLMHATGARTGLDGPYAYLETNEYKQSAIVGSGPVALDSYVTQLDGTEVGIPLRDRALNRALREIGVQVLDGTDECTAVGLMPYLRPAPSEVSARHEACGLAGDAELKRPPTP